MAMVVRSNLTALNANRQLGVNNSQVAKSLEKLSSGFRINRAGDDASGLAISEKMKAQIKGLEQASANAQDGISLVQTAEGAMTEVHNMLNRMTELATKSSNGTIQNEVDREAIQSEIDQLVSEIDRIGDATNFNGINLLDGTLGGGKKGAPASVGATIGGAEASVTTIAATAGSHTTGVVAAGTAVSTELTVKIANADGSTKDVKVSFTGNTDATLNAKAMTDALKAHADLKDFDISGDATGIKMTSKKTGSDASYVTALTGTGITAGAAGTAGADSKKQMKLDTLAAGDTVSINGKTYEMVAAGGTATGKGNIAFEDFAGLQAAALKDGITVGGTAAAATIAFDPTSKGQGLSLQVGDSNADFNKVTVSVDDVRSDGLGVKGLDVSTSDAAGAAIETIKTAINKVSTNRGNLGALQNRLEYAINNLDVTAENMTSANSRIRDTDMAKEMMNYTKMNVLTQSAQAMLAQANQQPQSILQLLQ